MEEVANLELTSSMIGVRAGQQGATEKTVAQIAKHLKDEGYIEDYDQTGLRTITGMSFGDLETNGVTLEIGETLSEIEAGFSTSNPSEDYYVQISGKKYPISKANGRISISKTEITLGTQPTGEITSVNAIPTGIVNAEKVSEKIDQIKITGVAKGTATVTAKYTDDIYATIPVTVKGNVSVTTRSANISVGTATTMTNESKVEGSQIPLTAQVTNQDYQFDGWYESIDSGTATQKSTSLSYTYTVPENATSVVVEARFSEKPQTFGTTSSDSGVGYYINKGTAQSPEYAIVFADRVAQQGTTVTWSSTNTSSCTFPPLDADGIAGFKTYQVNGTHTDSYFGEHPVLEVVRNTSGEDRFLALALSNLATNGTTYCWYYSAGATSPYMNDFNATGGTDGKGTPTSKAFLAGKTNTQTMITKWNNAGYGTKDAQGTYKDVWGQIQTQYANGWFVPSFEEWSAFGWAMSQGKLKQNVTSYSSLGLSNIYWSSSQYSTSRAWRATFNYGSMGRNYVFDSTYVRLATTF